MRLSIEGRPNVPQRMQHALLRSAVMTLLPGAKLQVDTGASTSSARKLVLWLRRREFPEEFESGRLTAGVYGNGVIAVQRQRA